MFLTLNGIGVKNKPPLHSACSAMQLYFSRFHLCLIKPSSQCPPNTPKVNISCLLKEKRPDRDDTFFVCVQPQVNLQHVWFAESASMTLRWEMAGGKHLSRHLLIAIHNPTTDFIIFFKCCTIKDPNASSVSFCLQSFCRGGQLDK